MFIKLLFTLLLISIHFQTIKNCDSPDEKIYGEICQDVSE
jgi:hypothetical protein